LLAHLVLKSSARSEQSVRASEGKTFSTTGVALSVNAPSLAFSFLSCAALTPLAEAAKGEVITALDQRCICIYVSATSLMQLAAQRV
jgi:hypothetical protein